MMELLETLCEIGRKLYSKESQRTSQSVLRLHLVTWRHWVLLREVLPTPKKLTKRKLWGYYSHALLAHAPIIYRVISLQQLNTEDEERMFGALKDITKRTSSMRPGEIEFNALIRLQEELKQKNPSHSHDKVVSKHAAQQSKLGNTVIKKDAMTKYSHHWQALLENISDYLVEGDGIWWRRLPNNNVEFFDIEVPISEGIPLKPYKKYSRSSNVTSISAHLVTKWMECVEKEIVLPVETFHCYNLQREDNIHTTHTESEEEEPATLTIAMTMCETDIFDACEQDEVFTKTDDGELEPVQHSLTPGTFDAIEQEPVEPKAKRPTDALPVTPKSNLTNSSTHSPPNVTTRHDSHEQQPSHQTPVRKGNSLQPVDLRCPPAKQYAFKTKLGTALSKLLGNDIKDIIDLDKVKLAIKQQPHSRFLQRTTSKLKAEYQQWYSKFMDNVIMIFVNGNKSSFQNIIDFQPSQTYAKITQSV